jgi:hypothetical protein
VILGLLQADRPNDKPSLPLPDILRLNTGKHNAKLKELRLRGIIIQNCMVRSADSAVHSWYALNYDPERDAAEVRP